jgi:hypothetical protein
MCGLLVAVLLLGRLAGVAQPVHLWLDARIQLARPLVRGRIAGRPVVIDHIDQRGSS